MRARDPGVMPPPVPGLGVCSSSILVGDVGDVGGGVVRPPDPGVLGLLGSLGGRLVVPPGLLGSLGLLGLLPRLLPRLGSLGSPLDPDDPPCGWPRLGHLPSGLPVFSSPIFAGRSAPGVPLG